MISGHYQHMVKHSIVQGTRHICALLGPLLQPLWFLRYVEASSSYASPGSDYRLTRQGSWEAVLSCFDFHFSSTANPISSICFPIAISLQKSLFTFTNNCWSIKAVFSARFCSWSAVSIIILIVTGILATQYMAYVICQSIPNWVPS